MTAREAALRANELWGDTAFVTKHPDTPLHKAFCEVGKVIGSADGSIEVVYGYGWKWEDAFADAKKRGHCK